MAIRNIQYKQHIDKSSNRTVIVDGKRMGEVEFLGRRKGKWVAYGGREIGFEHRSGFSARAKAAEWLASMAQLAQPAEVAKFRAHAD